MKWSVISCVSTELMLWPPRTCSFHLSRLYLSFLYTLLYRAALVILIEMGDSSGEGRTYGGRDG